MKNNNNLVFQLVFGMIISTVLLVIAYNIGQQHINPGQQSLSLEDWLHEFVDTSIGQMLGTIKETLLIAKRQGTNIAFGENGQNQVEMSANNAEKPEQKSDAAFKKVYQKSAYCHSPATEWLRVECANEYIRVKREFYKGYKD